MLEQEKEENKRVKLRHKGENHDLHYELFRRSQKI